MEEGLENSEKCRQDPGGAEDVEMGMSSRILYCKGPKIFFSLISLNFRKVPMEFENKSWR